MNATGIDQVNPGDMGVAKPSCPYAGCNHPEGECLGQCFTADANRAQVGDVNSNEKGSGARYNGGKVDMSLIPLSTLVDEARVWQYGKEKYAAWNWAKGMPWSVPFACLMRHMAAWQRGEENDPESGLPHLAHAMCNLRMLTLYATTYPEGDDRPTEWLRDLGTPTEATQ